MESARIGSSTRIVSSGTVPLPENGTGSVTRSVVPATTRRTTKEGVPPAVRDSREQPTRHWCSTVVATPSPVTRTRALRGKPPSLV